MRKAIRVLVTARVSDAANIGSDAQLFAGFGGGFAAAAAWQNDQNTGCSWASPFGELGGYPHEIPVDKLYHDYI